MKRFGSFIIIYPYILFECTGCQPTPNRNPPIQGSMIITANSEKELCFTPDFKSAHIGKKSYSINKVDNVIFELYQDNLGNQPPKSLILQLLPMKEGLSLIQGQNVCLNDKNNNFRQVIYKNPNKEGKYGINMSGVTNDKKYNIHFYKEFEYKYSLLK